MSYMEFLARLNYAILQIVYFRRRNILPPADGPVWLSAMLEEYFFEFSNSREELTLIIEAANSSRSFDELRLKLE